VLVLATLMVCAGSLRGLCDTSEGISSFPAEYFSGSSPATAYDVLLLTPGFRIEEGDPEMRGLAGASGNVMLDGQYPTSKQETLESQLRRIPYGQVQKIDIIRNAGAGYDMRGNSVIANIVRVSNSGISGRVDVETSSLDVGPTPKRFGGQVAFVSNARSVDLTTAVYADVDDRRGPGLRKLASPDGAILRYAQLDRPEWTDGQEFSGSFRQNVPRGTVAARAFFLRTKHFAEILEQATIPVPAFSDNRKLVRTNSRELSASFDRDMDSDRKLELKIISNRTVERNSESGVSTGQSRGKSQAAIYEEAIGSAVFRQQGGWLPVEAGIEGAINTLDHSSRIDEDGQAIDLPASDVRVEEKRAEAFVSVSWSPFENCSAETAARYELSNFTQTGDSELKKTLAFFKPRLASECSLGAGLRLNFSAEREIGQLDFQDFVSSPSILTGDVTVGNMDLEPDKTWRFATMLQHSTGSLAWSLTATHEEILDVIDHLPLISAGEIFDSVGNSGTAERNSIQLDSTLSLGPLGVSGATLRTNAIWTSSSMKDPVTGESRRISAESPSEIEVLYNQKLDRFHSRWGIQYGLKDTSTVYRVDEIKSESGNARLEVFYEYTPDPNWILRLFGKNLLDSSAVLDRVKFQGDRGSGGILYNESRSHNAGRYYGVSVSRSWP